MVKGSHKSIINFVKAIENKDPDAVVTLGAVIKGDIYFRKTLKTEEGADIDGYIKRIGGGKEATDEDIAIEEIVERPELNKPEVVPVAQSKEAG